jgi:hypothetical protein
MQLDVTVSLQHYRERRLKFTLVWTPDHPGTVRFDLPPLDHPFVQVSDLRVEADGAPIHARRRETQFSFDAAAPVTIRYSLATPFVDCMGADRHIDLILPFVNADEVFFGTGAVAYPSNLPQIAADLRVTFQLVDVPDGWDAFSSMITGGAHPAKLDGFFCYCSRRQAPEVTVFEGKEKRVMFRWRTQHGKTFEDLPFLMDGSRRWLEWLEANLAPYSGLDQIDVLLLRAPQDYQQETDGRAFATGENVLNGIVAYGSDGRLDCEQWGYSSYRGFLIGGLLHEIMHFYTSSVWSAAYKSILYPAPTCPRADQRLIGEVLNLYFSEQYARVLMGEPPAPPPERRASTGRTAPLALLSMLDRTLIARGSSLRALFAAMLERKRHERSPYPSAAWMFDVLRDDLGIDAPEVRALVV